MREWKRDTDPILYSIAHVPLIESLRNAQIPLLCCLNHHPINNMTTSPSLTHNPNDNPYQASIQPSNMAEYQSQNKPSNLKRKNKEEKEKQKTHENKLWV